MDFESTCWTLIEGAANGNADDRETFARLYEPIVRAYLGARWRETTLLGELDDAVQDVFFECFKEQGALGKAEPGGGKGGFRAFLHKVTQHVARRVEQKRSSRREQQAETGMELGELRGEDPHLSRVFDEAWMLSLLDQAVARSEALARAEGDAAVRRVDLLRLRFSDDLPIREIARRWEVPAAELHHDYAKAREEFKRALREVIAFHNPLNPAELEEEFLHVLERAD